MTIIIKICQLENVGSGKDTHYSALMMVRLITSCISEGRAKTTVVINKTMVLVAIFHTQHRGGL